MTTKEQAPAKMDRSRWEGCVECDDTDFTYWNSDVKFCPFCGRPLTEEAEAALKKREADNETESI